MSAGLVDLLKNARMGRLLKRTLRGKGEEDDAELVALMGNLKVEPPAPKPSGRESRMDKPILKRRPTKVEKEVARVSGQKRKLETIAEVEEEDEKTGKGIGFSRPDNHEAAIKIIAEMNGWKSKMPMDRYEYIHKVYKDDIDRARDESGDVNWVDVVIMAAADDVGWRGKTVKSAENFIVKHREDALLIGRYSPTPASPKPASPKPSASPRVAPEPAPARPRARSPKPDGLTTPVAATYSETPRPEPPPSYKPMDPVTEEILAVENDAINRKRVIHGLFGEDKAEAKRKIKRYAFKAHPDKGYDPDVFRRVLLIVEKVYGEKMIGSGMPKGNKAAGFVGLMLAKKHLKRGTKNYDPEAREKKTPAKFHIRKIREPSEYIKTIYSKKGERANLTPEALAKRREEEKLRQRKSRAARRGVKVEEEKVQEVEIPEIPKPALTKRKRRPVKEEPKKEEPKKEEPKKADIKRRVGTTSADFPAEQKEWEPPSIGERKPISASGETTLPKKYFNDWHQQVRSEHFKVDGNDITVRQGFDHRDRMETMVYYWDGTSKYPSNAPAKLEKRVLEVWNSVPTPPIRKAPANLPHATQKHHNELWLKEVKGSGKPITMTKAQFVKEHKRLIGLIDKMAEEGKEQKKELAKVMKGKGKETTIYERTALGPPSRELGLPLDLSHIPPAHRGDAAKMLFPKGLPPQSAPKKAAPSYSAEHILVKGKGKYKDDLKKIYDDFIKLSTTFTHIPYAHLAAFDRDPRQKVKNLYADAYDSMVAYAYDRAKKDEILSKFRKAVEDTKKQLADMEASHREMEEKYARRDEAPKKKPAPPKSVPKKPAPPKSNRGLTRPVEATYSEVPRAEPPPSAGEVPTDYILNRLLEVADESVPLDTAKKVVFEIFGESIPAAKRSIKKFVFKYHPDKGGDEELFKALNELFEEVYGERMVGSGKKGGRKDIPPELEKINKVEHRIADIKDAIPKIHRDHEMFKRRLAVLERDIQMMEAHLEEYQQKPDFNPHILAQMENTIEDATNDYTRLLEGAAKSHSAYQKALADLDDAKGVLAALKSGMPALTRVGLS